MALNLARRPFQNARPLRRLSLLLFGSGLALLAVDGWLYARYFDTSSGVRAELRAARQQAADETRRIAEIERSLAAFQLDLQGERVEFLNGLIEQRAFPWSRLFERLSAVLPQRVRLHELRPELEDRRGERRRRAARASGARTAGERPVRLQMSGTAENSDAMLALLDRLFEHPAFVEPTLRSESEDAGAGIRFELDVGYLPYAGDAAGAHPGLAGAPAVAGQPGSEGDAAAQAPPAAGSLAAAAAPVGRGAGVLAPAGDPAAAETTAASGGEAAYEEQALARAGVSATVGDPAAATPSVPTRARPTSRAGSGVSAAVPLLPGAPGGGQTGARRQPGGRSRELPAPRLPNASAPPTGDGGEG